jgi:replicative DNA helicase
VSALPLDEVMAIVRRDRNRANGWPDPDPLDDPTTAPVAPFPTDHMPPIFRNMIRAVAANKQVPEDLPALLGLGATSTLAGPRIGITRGRGWTEPLNTYSCVGMESGTGKTPAEKDVTAPLRRIQKRLAVDYRDWVDQQIDRLDLARSNTNLLRGREGATEANRVEDDIRDLKKNRDTGHPRLLFGSDITIETLPVRMADNGDAAAIVDSEGEFFGILSGRYSNGVPNLGIALKAYDGDWYDVNRLSRTAKPLSRAILTLALGTQPRVLAEVAKSAAMVERGLLARFLLAVPTSLLGTRDPEGADYDTDAMDAWADALEKIAQIPIPPPDEEPFPALRLAADAHRQHVAFCAWLEPRLGSSGDLGDMPGWAAKHRGRVLRIAGLLHLLAGRGVDELVSGHAMSAAVEVGRWAIPHARLVFGFNAVSLDEDAERCLQVVNWIKRDRPELFTAREARRAVRKSWVNAASMVEVLAELVARGWLRDRQFQDKAHRVNVGYSPHPLLIEGGE